MYVSRLGVFSFEESVNSQRSSFNLQDLEKSVSDLLSEDYVRDISLEVKTSTKPMTFEVTGKRGVKSKVLTCDVKGKYFDRKNGVTLTQKWTTTNELVTFVGCDSKFAKGVKFDLEARLNPADAQKSFIANVIHKKRSLETKATVDSLKVSVELASLSISMSDGWIRDIDLVTFFESRHAVGDGEVCCRLHAAVFQERSYS